MGNRRVTENPRDMYNQEENSTVNPDEDTKRTIDETSLDGIAD